MRHTHEPSWQIVTGHKFSPNKSFAVHEKTNTPRSCLRWIPTGRICNTVGLRWVPTGKKFTSSTTKVDCEPLNGSNEDITNPYECNQTLKVSAGTLNLSAGLILTIRRKLKDGGEVKEFQRSFRHSDTERLSRSDEVLKLKNFKKDATLKLFKSTNQERYGYIKNHKKTVQNGQARTRESEEYKKKPRIQSRSQKAYS
ncbi:hypothetical protein Tco_0572461 [Tanacetum coccineum]